ncbi:MAG: acyl-CoA dehydrogenase family protein [Deltaproteobacteria bacterium]|nr:acyl-CoA dehydrogenase family protein [Deltaproteobacteria bacterium]
MWFFTDEHRLLEKSVRDFAQSVLGPRIEHLDETEQTDKSYFKKMADLGLLGITAPEEYGGTRMGCVAATIAMEEIGAVDASTALSDLAHSYLTVNNIATNASEAQKQKYLPKMISGDWIGGMGMTEPGAGSDALAMRTRAVKKGDKYILNGTKMFITNAIIGDVFYVYARTGDGRKDISTFIVESKFPGFKMGKKLKKMGMRASPTGELIFENCEVPDENLVGGENQAVGHMLKNLDIERITISGISLGIARASLEVAVKYAKERHQFGKPIADFQMIQAMLADGQAEYEAARFYTYGSAQMWDEGKLTGSSSRALSAKVKLVAARMATKVALDAIQILGGYGYIKEFPVERYMRDAKLMEIGAGSNEMMRVIAARDMLGDL